MKTITVHRAELRLEDGFKADYNIESVFIFKEDDKVIMGMWLDSPQTEIYYKELESDIVKIEAPFATFVVKDTEELLHELFCNSKLLIQISQL